MTTFKSTSNSIIGSSIGSVTIQAATNKLKQNNGTIEESGFLIVSYSTGQSMHIPLKAQVATPIIVISSPKLEFGVCHVTKSCEGVLLLSNPTGVTANFVVTHVGSEVNGSTTKKFSTIRVKGYSYDDNIIDDESVFTISPMSGSVAGPTVSAQAAIAAPPKDTIRG